MQKKTVTAPVYDSVQVGTRWKEVWVTSDGEEFSNENSANCHEFYTSTLHRRDFSEVFTLLEAFIGDFPDEESLHRLENTFFTFVYDKAYDASTLHYPDTYALYTTEEGEENCLLHCIPLEGYKQILRNAIDSI